MLNHPNPNRQISSDDNLDTLTLENHIRQYALAHGVNEAFRCFGQATVDLLKMRFMDSMNLEQECKQLPNVGFKGSHKSAYLGPNGMLVRSEEYPMSFDDLLNRIHGLQKVGLDGYITSESTHFPLATFGIVAFPKGTYRNSPGFRG